MAQKFVSLTLTGDNQKELIAKGETIKSLGGIGYVVKVADDGQLYVASLVPPQDTAYIFEGSGLTLNARKHNWKI